jgi:hypothetical protein
MGELFGSYPKGLSVIYVSCESREKANKGRKGKENLTNPICSELAELPQFTSAPATSDEN